MDRERAVCGEVLGIKKKGLVGMAKEVLTPTLKAHQWKTKSCR